MNLLLRSVVLLGLIAPLVPGQSPAPAAWPQFRGPGGIASLTSPVRSLTFDRERDVRWRAELPAGHSSPCVWGDLIFLTGWDEKQLLMLALDRKTGREAWRVGVEPRTRRGFDHKDSTIAMPSPCTNGKRVFFYFGAYGLVVTDMAGKTTWSHDFGSDEGVFGVGTSPMLIDDLVIVSRDGRKDSAIFAFSEADGTLRWKAPRLTFIDSHGTPFVWNHAQRTELVVGGTSCIMGLDPKTGEELWQVNGLTRLVCTTPAADRERLYFAAWSTGNAHGKERLATLFGDTIEFTAEEKSDGAALFRRLDKNEDGGIVPEELPPCRLRDTFDYCDRNDDGRLELKEVAGIVKPSKRRGKNIAIAVSAGGSGDVTDTHVAWRQRRNIPYVASPLLHEGRLYFVKSGGVISCLDPATGRPLFGPERLGDGSEYYSSPIGVEGHVIVCSSAGTVFVLKASDELEIVSKVALGERILATPAVVEGVVYVRGDRHLWAFGR